MSKQTLFQIVAENHQLMSDIMENGGEVTPEIEKRFKELGSELVQKVDNYVELMARLDSEADHFKKREQEMKNAKITMQNIQKRLRDAVLSALDSLNQKEVQGDTYRIMIAKTKPKIEYVESNIPDAYFNEVVERKLNKKMIEEEIKMGMDIPGVHVMESRSVRKYTRKVTK